MFKELTPTPVPALTRRTIFSGAAAIGAVSAVGAIAAAAKLPPASSTPLLAKALPADTGGYQLTDHVKHYYATARV